MYEAEPEDEEEVTINPRAAPEAPQGLANEDDGQRDQVDGADNDILLLMNVCQDEIADSSADEAYETDSDLENDY